MTFARTQHAVSVAVADPGESMPGPRHVEESVLTLTAEPAAARGLGDLLVRRNMVDGVARRRAVRTFFDTADHRLAHRGAALVLEARGGAPVQRLVVAERDPFGIERRTVWTGRAGDSAPDIHRLVDDVTRERLGLILPGALAPVATAAIESLRGRMAGPPGSGRVAISIESATFDERGGGRASVTLSLEAGAAPWLLAERAAALHRIAPLRVARMPAPWLDVAAAEPPVKAVRSPLDPTMTVTAAAEAMLRSCVAHWTGNEVAAFDGDDPEGVHQLRVALRRLRSLLALFAPVAAPDLRRGLSAEARWLAGETGAARDWDVFAAEVLAPLRRACPKEPDLARLADAVAAERRAGYARVREALASPRPTALLLALAESLERGSLWSREPEAAEVGRDSIAVFADRVLRARHRKLLRRGRDFAALPEAERHRVRIAVKKLRYAEDFFQPLLRGKRAKRSAAALAALQEELGAFNDIAVGRRLVADLAAGGTAVAAGRGTAIVLGWFARADADLEPRLLARWAEFSELPRPRIAER